MNLAVALGNGERAEGPVGGGHCGIGEKKSGPGWVGGGFWVLLVGWGGLRAGF